MPIPTAMHWRLPARCPCSSDKRLKHEAALVDQDDRPPLAPGFFLIAGHRRFRNSSTALSSRSRANRSGFWALKPIAHSSRCTWEIWYRIPNWSSMSLATRDNVHSSLCQPKARGPATRQRRSFAFWAGVIRDFPPACGFESRPRSPFLSTACVQRTTDDGTHPTCSATARTDSPCFRRRTAVRRRISSSCFVPFGLIPSIDQKLDHSATSIPLPGRRSIILEHLI